MMTKSPSPSSPHEMLFLTSRSIIVVSIIHAQSNRLHIDCVSFSAQLRQTFANNIFRLSLRASSNLHAAALLDGRNLILILPFSLLNLNLILRAWPRFYPRSTPR